MNKWVIFWLSIIFMASFLGCGRKMSELQRTDQQWDASAVHPIFCDTITEIVYDMSIQYKDSKNSGILAVARDSQGYYRMAFMNKVGPKLFDLTFTPEEMKVNSIINSLNKKILLNILEKDFRMLFDPMRIVNHDNYINTSDGGQVIKWKGRTTHYYYLLDNGQIKTAHRAKGCRSIVEMNLSYDRTDRPSHIDIQHNRIPLTLMLKLL